MEGAYVPSKKDPLIDSDEDIEEVVHQETQDIPLPDITGAEYLVSFLHDAGTAMQTGMGLVPLTWQEVESWARCSLSDVTPWELKVIKRLSEAYASEFSQASDVKRLQPYTPKAEIEELDRTAISNKVENIFALFKNKNRGL